MRLIFIRHGDPDYEHDSLTEKGRREAQILAERFKTWENIDYIYNSPLGRAKETCEYSLKASGRTSETLDFLEEVPFQIYHPDYDRPHVPWDYFPATFSPEAGYYDRDRWFDTGVYKDSGLKEYYFKTVQAFDEVLARHGLRRNDQGFYETDEDSDKTLVFFCHYGITSILTGHLTGIAPPCLWQGFFIATTGVTVLNTDNRDREKTGFRVQVWGDVSHLLKAGEPVSPSGYFGDIFGG